MKYVVFMCLSFSAMASLESLVSEYLNSSTDIKTTQYLLENQRLLFQLEEVKRPLTLTYVATDSTSNLQESVLVPEVTDAESFTHFLSVDKPVIWGGVFSLSATKYEYENASSFNSYNQKLSYTQSLGKNFLGRNDFNDLEIARKTTVYQELNYESAKSKNVLDFIYRYLDVKKQLAATNIQERARKRAKARLNLVKKQVKDGLKEKVDLYSSQTSYNTAVEGLELQKARLKSAKLNFEQKLERRISSKEVSAYRIRSERLPRLSKVKLDQNLDIRSLSEKLAYLSIEEENSKNEVFPTISLKASYETNAMKDPSGSSFSDGGFGSDNSAKTLALTVSMPLTFSIERNARKRATLNRLQAEYEKRLKYREIEAHFAKIEEALKMNSRNLKSVLNRYELAKKTVREYNRLYNRGRATLDTVIRSEEALLDTESSYLEYKIEWDRNYYAMLDLMGKLAEVVGK